MAKVKIINRGERTIFHDEGELVAGKAGLISEEIANKLRALYPDEVQSIDDMFKEFEEKAADIADEAEETVKPKKSK